MSRGTHAHHGPCTVRWPGGDCQGSNVLPRRVRTQNTPPDGSSRGGWRAPRCQRRRPLGVDPSRRARGPRGPPLPAHAVLLVCRTSLPQRRQQRGPQPPQLTPPQQPHGQLQLPPSPPTPTRPAGHPECPPARPSLPHSTSAGQQPVAATRTPACAPHDTIARGHTHTLPMRPRAGAREGWAGGVRNRARAPTHHWVADGAPFPARRDVGTPCRDSSSMSGRRAAAAVAGLAAATVTAAPTRRSEPASPSIGVNVAASSARWRSGSPSAARWYSMVGWALAKLLCALRTAPRM